MTRIIKVNNKYDVQDKFLWFWMDRTAQDGYGNDLPCTLTGFDTLNEAIAECQTTDFYLHNSVFEAKQLSKEDKDFIQNLSAEMKRLVEVVHRLAEDMKK